MSKSEQRHEELDMRLDKIKGGFRASAADPNGVLISAEGDTEIAAIMALIGRLHPGYDIEVSPFALMAGIHGNGLRGTLTERKP